MNKKQELPQDTGILSVLATLVDECSECALNLESAVGAWLDSNGTHQSFPISEFQSLDLIVQIQSDISAIIRSISDADLEIEALLEQCIERLTLVPKLEHVRVSLQKVHFTRHSTLNVDSLSMERQTSEKIELF